MMSKSTLIAIAASAALTACATTESRDVSPAFGFTDDAGKSHFVTGHIVKTYDDNFFTTSRAYKLIVQDSGATVIEGPLDPYSFAGTAAGAIGQKPAVAHCTSVQKSPQWWDVTCEIAVEGKVVGKLTF
ncbi:hypothetical protein [Rhodocyclus gracilis]|uniref:Lipoprotein n=1 Tax=Rhodocyclus tenuis TaxID=1066 RepID=A0A6L5JTU0_RHOTE|nr:hypothetical protein [Rhodocyclus gracilis]MQY50825.1 hypothetical protein [Rhodocyclus gracilis]